MGTTNLGKVGITPRKAWNAGTANYEHLDTVTYAGGSYMVILPTGYVPVGTLPTNTAYFELQAAPGAKGDTGLKGWQPSYANVADGSRVVQRLVDYTGGEGTKPTENINSYVGATGFTTNIANATDVKGAAGTSGEFMEDITGTITDGSCFVGTGVITPVATNPVTRRTDKIPLIGVVELWINTFWASTNTGLRNVFFGADGNTVISVFGSTGGVLTKITIPVGAAFVGVTGAAGSTLLVQSKYTIQNIKPQVVESTSSVLSLKEVDTSYSLVRSQKTFSTGGFYDRLTGVFTVNVPWMYTSKFDVEGKKIMVSGVFGNIQGSNITYFDANDKFISSVYPIPANSINYLLTPPITAKTAAMSHQPVGVPTCVVINDLGYDASKKIKDYVDAGFTPYNKFTELGKSFEQRKAAMINDNFGILWLGQSNAEGQLIPYSRLAELSLPNTSSRTLKWDGTAFVAFSIPSNGFWGPWWSLTLRLDNYLTKPILYVNKAVRGTTLYSNWNPESNVITGVANAGLANVAALEIGKVKVARPSINFKCIIWIQGESDNTSPNNANYYQNLKNFIAFERGVMQNPILPFIVVGMHKDQGGYDALVRAGQVQAVSEDPNARFINPDGLTWSSVGDGLHYSGEYCELLAPLIFNVIKDF